MTLANSTWYFDVNEGGSRPVVIKVVFGAQNNDGGAVTVGGASGMWAESNGLFTIELSGGAMGFESIWTGEYRGKYGSGFGSPEFNNMAFNFSMSTTVPSVELSDLGEFMASLKQKAA